MVEVGKATVLALDSDSDVSWPVLGDLVVEGTSGVGTSNETSGVGTGAGTYGVGMSVVIDGGVEAKVEGCAAVEWLPDPL